MEPIRCAGSCGKLWERQQLVNGLCDECNSVGHEEADYQARRGQSTARPLEECESHDTHADGSKRDIAKAYLLGRFKHLQESLEALCGHCGSAASVAEGSGLPTQENTWELLGSKIDCLERWMRLHQSSLIHPLDIE